MNAHRWRDDRTNEEGWKGADALAETLFSTLKVKLAYRTSFRTRGEADLALFRHIDG